jgi:hypothetical protein
MGYFGETHPHPAPPLEGEGVYSVKMFSANRLRKWQQTSHVSHIALRQVSLSSSQRENEVKLKQSTK